MVSSLSKGIVGFVRLAGGAMDSDNSVAGLAGILLGAEAAEAFDAALRVAGVTDDDVLAGRAFFPGPAFADFCAAIRSFDFASRACRFA